MKIPIDLPERIDKFLDPLYRDDEPGIAVVVVENGNVIFRKGYGMANLEVRTPIEPHMVFRLGSITKQFTAVCILMLMERGELNLQDEITRFLPEYPVGKRSVTIEHLLTHTSGVKSYTALPEWLSLWRKDMSVNEIIDIFKDQPFDFEPGEGFRYNNSGYILLGAIIENASNMKYAEFVRKNIFEPLGMSHSLYDDAECIVPGRVSGYSKRENGFVNATYLSMSQPYAAGALASSVDDLVLWDAALRANKLLKSESLALAFTPYRLKNGDSTRYGYGWIASEYDGFQFVQHNGGINGFATSSIMVPAEKIYVAVLGNNDVPNLSPGIVALNLMGLAVGRPIIEPQCIDMPVVLLDEYVGMYKINEKDERIVVCQGIQLFSQLNGGVQVEICPVSSDEFFVKGAFDKFTFIRDVDGRVIGLHILRSFGPLERYLRIRE